MLSVFLTTLIFPLIVAVICRFITYNLDLFNVSLSGRSGASQITSSVNPLIVILEYVPNNIDTVLITINIPAFTTTLNMIKDATTTVVIAKSENTLYLDIYNS
ncbi:hypothetical protein [Terrisporobacter sp.]|uniref:hypothetical protein n=1 Tax=Terrisporobacter sp. TaxID=1965305 RepID=UPI002606B8B7|nr:hypothetical protein [Terrisporobacter sp.]